MPSCIRVGFVIGQLSYGGAERELYELVRGLDRQRFPCVVYCLSERVTPFGEMIAACGVPVRVLRRRGHLDVSRLARLATWLRRDRIELVHAFLFLANGYAWAASRLAGVPYLITSLRNCKQVGRLMAWTNRLAFRGSDAIACNGVAVRAYLGTQYGAPLARSVVIYNGVDVERFRPASAAAHGTGIQGPRTKIVLAIGRLVEQKDLVLFLEAAALLIRKVPDTCFRIVGDGPDRAELEHTAERLGLREHVAFLGERSDIPELLQAANVLWLTSAWEGFPNVVLEALACGIPVVARNVGACGEIIEPGVQGYLVDTRDPEPFARHTARLLADPARAARMGRAGRQLAERKFSVDIMIRGTEQLYASIRTTRCTDGGD